MYVEACVPLLFYYFNVSEISLMMCLIWQAELFKVNRQLWFKNNPNRIRTSCVNKNRTPYIRELFRIKLRISTINLTLNF